MKLLGTVNMMDIKVAFASLYYKFFNKKTGLGVSVNE